MLQKSLAEPEYTGLWDAFLNPRAPRDASSSGLRDSGLVRWLRCPFAYEPGECHPGRDLYRVCISLGLQNPEPPEVNLGSSAQSLPPFWD